MCNNEDELFFKNCVDWFYSFTDSIESEFEENDSLQKLEKFIATAKEKDINHRLIARTLLYLEKSFKKICFVRDTTNICSVGMFQTIAGWNLITAQ